MKLNNVLDELSHVFATRWVASPGWGHVSREDPEPWLMPGADSDIGVPVSHLTNPSLSGLEEKEFWPDSPIGSLRRE